MAEVAAIEDQNVADIQRHLNDAMNILGVGSIPAALEKAKALKHI